MKTIPPPCPEPEIGPKYWRSIDQLEDTPEFRKWAETEFPAGASELKDDVTRRSFMKLMSASFLLAGFGLAGCRKPEEKIYPFSKMPEGYVHGVAQYYATAMPNRGGAIPLLAKSHDGRPVKVEGNGQHPDSNGGTNLFAQASLLNLYDPDRAQRFTKGGNNVTREAAFDFLKETAEQFAKTDGAGLAFLADSSGSPSRARLQAVIAQKYPKAKWYTYEPVDFAIHSRAAGIVAGEPVTPYYRLDHASIILSLDCDFIGGEAEDYRLIRGFSAGRKVSKPGDKMNRLYAVEALMTQTGANADHRLRVSSSSVIQVAAAVAAEVIKLTGSGSEFSSALGALSAGLKIDAKWVTECAKDLAANKGSAVVLAGQRQPLAVHVIANAMNAALGAFGKTVVFYKSAAEAPGIAELAKALNGGQVETLVLLGGNPVYNAPADLDWAKTQGKAKTVIRLGYHEDETFAGCTWHLPAAHYLESWGDARTSDGTLVPVQPLIEPLFGGVTELEFLARIAGASAVKPYDVVRETFKGLAGSANVEEAWKKFLHDGFLAGSAAKPVAISAQWADAAKIVAGAAAPVLPSKDKLELVFHRDYSVDDGRYSNNSWVQEVPDPISKITWDNVVTMSRKTSEDLGVKNKEIVSISLNGRTIQGPAWVQPGQADNVLGLALGYGRTKGGRVANFKGGTVGFNVYPLRTTGAENIAVGAKLATTGQLYKISCTQDHWSMEGRPIVREANLQQYNAKPDFAKNMDLDGASHIGFIPKDEKVPGAPKNIYTHPYVSHPELKSQTHQWGMSIDLSSCVGCSACMVACQSENNIPVVGKEQVGNGREMHWMRIDRYFSGGVRPKKAGFAGVLEEMSNDEKQVTQPWIDDPQVVNQPMMCQHCESAPCESVCPVNATVHDEEGLNVMAYNRCIGTRYCSNNCAWKARRFNFFDYNKRPIEHLYDSPLTSAKDGEWEMMRWWNNPDQSSRPNDEWEIIKLVKNPEVTVRMRGVMEKCTFCLQRIESAKITQKVKAKDSGDVTVPDGTIKTACQQACPAEAIVFGNILDKESKVSKLKEQQRNYAVLGFLDTKPRLTYLAKLRNPNPAMPDALIHKSPLTIEEYEDRGNGNPFDDHGHAEGGEAHGEKKGTH